MTSTLLWVSSTVVTSVTPYFYKTSSFDIRYLRYFEVACA